MSRRIEGLPKTNEGYGTKEYWEQRYTLEADGTTFDWFLTPEYLLPIFEELTGDGKGKETRMLMLGCGNSRLSEVLYDAGWKNIVNIDYSKALIETMIRRHGETRPEMEWLEMDVLDLKFNEGEFDLVVDKGELNTSRLTGIDADGNLRLGTMDATLTTKGDPWNPPQKDIDTCTQEISEALRVLRKQPGSKFVYFTFGQPHFRKRYMEHRPGFMLNYREIGPPEGLAYFMYLLTYTG